MRQGTGHRAQGTGEENDVASGRWPVAGNDRGQDRPRATERCGAASRDSLPASGGGTGGRERPGGGRSGRGTPRIGGFTLIELIVVMAIIGILAAIAVPAMKDAPQRARESALKEDLFTLRSCLDQFHADRGRFPTSLDELVSMGYLRSVPVDPMTRSKDTWVVIYEDASAEPDERQQTAGAGIIDIHSGSDQLALDGTTKYSDW